MNNQQAIAQLSQAGVAYNVEKQGLSIESPGAWTAELECRLVNPDLPPLTKDELLALGRAMREQLIIIYQQRPNATQTPN